MFEAYPVELRPVLTRHRLRRRRHRSAASLLTGAALALGLAASRPIPAGASTVRHAARVERVEGSLNGAAHRPPANREPPRPVPD
jgi:hypothetical protein